MKTKEAGRNSSGEDFVGDGDWRRHLGFFVWPEIVRSYFEGALTKCQVRCGASVRPLPVVVDETTIDDEAELEFVRHACA